MDNGCKPTHLWHFISLKHFQCLLNGKLGVNPFQQRHKYQQLLTVFVIAALAIGTKYSFGQITFPKKIMDVYYPSHIDGFSDKNYKNEVAVKKNKEDETCPCKERKERENTRKTQPKGKKAKEACKCD